MTKMTVNLPVAIVAIIKSLAVKRGTTMTEIIRYAIGAEKYLDDVQSDGGKVLVEDRNGRIREVIFGARVRT